MRTCVRCGKNKPLDQFHFADRKRGWRRGECHDCERERHRGYASQSRAAIRVGRQTYKNEASRKASEWARSHPERRREIALAYYYRVQDAAIRAYGGYKCSCCGETEPLFLTIDHVNNDGRIHRKQIGSLGGHKFYTWLRDNKYPAGFAVLCMNCNHGRHRNGGICPHKEGATTIP